MACCENKSIGEAKAKGGLETEPTAAIVAGQFGKAWSALVSERMAGNFGGCVNVCCDLPSFDAAFEFIVSELPACANIAAAFGIHPVRVVFLSSALCCFFVD